MIGDYFADHVYQDWQQPFLWESIDDVLANTRLETLPLWLLGTDVAAQRNAIELEPGDAVIGMVVIRREATLLVVSGKGFGKRSELADYRVQRRGGKGIITFRKTEKTGACVALKEVLPEDQLMMITKGGIIIRVPVADIRVIGRNTQGVHVMHLDEGDLVVDVARVVKEEEGGAEEPAPDEAPTPGETA